MDKTRFPYIFRMEQDKRCLVADRYNQDNRNFMGVWNWSRSPSSAEELLEWHELIGLLDNVTLSDGKDGWEWLGGNDSDFSVNAVKNFLYSGSDFSSRHVVKWSKWVPKNAIFLFGGRF